MKKRIITLVSILALAVLLCFVVACTPQTPKQTVTFETNGGTEIQSVKVDKGNCIDEPAQPTREGYTFDGWYIDSDFEEEFKFTTPIDADVTLYAKWTSELKYTLSSDGLYYAVTGVNTLKDNYSIFAEYQGKTVKEIGGYAFRDCGSLTSIEIPNSVTRIGDSAFYYCISLTSIEIPDSVTSIGEDAFSYCTSLTSIEIPESVISIGARAFAYCYRLRSVTFGENSKLTSIGRSAFYNCDNLTSIEIPDSVTSIGSDAFTGCKSLTNIEISDSIKNIGEDAFYGCSSLTSIEIPDSVTSIGEYAFYGCNNLIIYCEATSKPSGWNSNWNYSSRPVVWNCRNNNVANDGYIYTTINGLKYAIKDGVAKVEKTHASGDITIPSSIIYDSSTYSVTIIGEEAFYNCDSLTSITIPNSVTSIGEWAFYRCRSLTSITLPDRVTSIGEHAFAGCDSLTIIEIPDSVTSIGYSVFYDCDSLTNIEIPSSVKSIEGYAFRDCDNLTSIEIPGSVTSIGEYAFYNCDSLTSIEIPGSVTSIGGSAFYDCGSLTSIIIPDSVTSIGYNAFYRCSKLTIYCEVASKPSDWNSNWNNSNRPVVWDCRNNNVADDGYIYGIIIDGINYAVKDNEARVLRTNASGDIVIPSSIIYDSKSYTVTAIEGRAFAGCFRLTSIEIPASVTSVGEYAFDGCCFLTIYCEVEVQPSGWGSYWNYSNRPIVWDCKNNNVASDGYIYGITIDGINYAVRYGTAKVVGTNASGDTAIPSSIIYNSTTCEVISIGSYAFYNCSNLSNITIPTSVTSIGEYAFYNCSSITSIKIPDSVTSIGDNAFRSCSKLTIYCETESKPSGWNSSWNPSNCPVVWGYKGE